MSVPPADQVPLGNFNMLDGNGNTGYITNQINVQSPTAHDGHTGAVPSPGYTYIVPDRVYSPQVPCVYNAQTYLHNQQASGYMYNSTAQHPNTHQPGYMYNVVAQAQMVQQIQPQIAHTAQHLQMQLQAQTPAVRPSYVLHAGNQPLGACSPAVQQGMGNNTYGTDSGAYSYTFRPVPGTVVVSSVSYTSHGNTQPVYSGPMMMSKQNFTPSSVQYRADLIGSPDAYVRKENTATPGNASYTAYNPSGQIPKAARSSVQSVSIAVPLATPTACTANQDAPLARPSPSCTIAHNKKPFSTTLDSCTPAHSRNPSFTTHDSPLLSSIPGESMEGTCSSSSILEQLYHIPVVDLVKTQGSTGVACSTASLIGNHVTSQRRVRIEGSKIIELPSPGNSAFRNVVPTIQAHTQCHTTVNYAEDHMHVPSVGSLSSVSAVNVGPGASMFSNSAKPATQDDTKLRTPTLITRGNFETLITIDSVDIDVSDDDHLCGTESTEQSCLTEGNATTWGITQEPQSQDVNSASQTITVPVSVKDETERGVRVIEICPKGSEDDSYVINNKTADDLANNNCASPINMNLYHHELHNSTETTGNTYNSITVDYIKQEPSSPFMMDYCIYESAAEAFIEIANNPTVPEPIECRIKTEPPDPEPSSYTTSLYTSNANLPASQTLTLSSSTGISDATECGSQNFASSIDKGTACSRETLGPDQQAIPAGMSGSMIEFYLTNIKSENTLDAKSVSYRRGVDTQITRSPQDDTAATLHTPVMYTHEANTTSTRWIDSSDNSTISTRSTADDSINYDLGRTLATSPMDAATSSVVTAPAIDTADANSTQTMAPDCVDTLPVASIEEANANNWNTNSAGAVCSQIPTTDGAGSTNDKSDIARPALGSNTTGPQPSIDTTQNVILPTLDTESVPSAALLVTNSVDSESCAPDLIDGASDLIADVKRARSDFIGSTNVDTSSAISTEATTSQEVIYAASLLTDVMDTSSANCASSALITTDDTTTTTNPIADSNVPSAGILTTTVDTATTLSIPSLKTTNTNTFSSSPTDTIPADTIRSVQDDHVMNTAPIAGSEPESVTNDPIPSMDATFTESTHPTAMDIEDGDTDTGNDTNNSLSVSERANETISHLDTAAVSTTGITTRPLDTHNASPLSNPAVETTDTATNDISSSLPHDLNAASTLSYAAMDSTFAGTTRISSSDTKHVNMKSDPAKESCDAGTTTEITSPAGNTVSHTKDTDDARDVSASTHASTLSNPAIESTESGTISTPQIVESAEIVTEPPAMCENSVNTMDVHSGVKENTSHSVTDASLGEDVTVSDTVSLIDNAETSDYSERVSDMLPCITTPISRAIEEVDDRTQPATKPNVPDNDTSNDNTDKDNTCDAPGDIRSNQYNEKQDGVTVEDSEGKNSTIKPIEINKENITPNVKVSQSVDATSLRKLSSIGLKDNDMKPSGGQEGNADIDDVMPEAGDHTPGDITKVTDAATYKRSNIDTPDTGTDTPSHPSVISVTHEPTTTTVIEPGDGNHNKEDKAPIVMPERRVRSVDNDKIMAVPEQTTPHLEMVNHLDQPAQPTGNSIVKVTPPDVDVTPCNFKTNLGVSDIESFLDDVGNNVSSCGDAGRHCPDTVSSYVTVTSDLEKSASPALQTQTSRKRGRPTAASRIGSPICTEGPCVSKEPGEMCMGDRTGRQAGDKQDNHPKLTSILKVMTSTGENANIQRSPDVTARGNAGMWSPIIVRTSASVSISCGKTAVKTMYTIAGPKTSYVTAGKVTGSTPTSVLTGSPRVKHRPAILRPAPSITPRPTPSITPRPTPRLQGRLPPLCPHPPPLLPGPVTSTVRTATSVAVGLRKFNLVKAENRMFLVPLSDNDPTPEAVLKVVPHLYNKSFPPTSGSRNSQYVFVDVKRIPNTQNTIAGVTTTSYGIGFMGPSGNKLEAGQNRIVTLRTPPRPVSSAPRSVSNIQRPVSNTPLPLSSTLRSVRSSPRITSSTPSLVRPPAVSRIVPARTVYPSVIADVVARHKPEVQCGVPDNRKIVVNPPPIVRYPTPKLPAYGTKSVATGSSVFSSHSTILREIAGNTQSVTSGYRGHTASENVKQEPAEDSLYATNDGVLAQQLEVGNAHTPPESTQEKIRRLKDELRRKNEDVKRMREERQESRKRLKRCIDDDWDASQGNIETIELD